MNNDKIKSLRAKCGKSSPDYRNVRQKLDSLLEQRIKEAVATYGPGNLRQIAMGESLLDRELRAKIARMYKITEDELKNAILKIVGS